MPIQSFPPRAPIQVIDDPLLAQLRPSTTGIETLYTVPVNRIGEIDEIIVTNVSNNNTVYKIFIAEDGVTFDETTAIAWDISIPKADIDFISGQKHLPAGTVIAVEINNANNINFTATGQELII